MAAKHLAASQRITSGSAEKTASDGVRSVAIVGSFRKHYETVLATRQRFLDAGLVVTSPRGTWIVGANVDFVRFHTDPEHWDDPTVQTVALQLIFQADFTYVIAPEGYVGRTTCYELGRLIQAAKPVYFSDVPTDLPIRIPREHIYSPNEICERIAQGTFVPQPLYVGEASDRAAIETRIIQSSAKVLR
jgi:hypothetical protein